MFQWIYFPKTQSSAADGSQVGGTEVRNSSASNLDLLYLNYSQVTDL